MPGSKVEIAAPRQHSMITFSDTVNLTITYRELICITAGTFQVVDELDTVIGYVLAVGARLPFQPKRINATSSTGTIAGWL